MEQQPIFQCAICGAALHEPRPYVLYHSEKTQEESFACPACAQHLLTLMQEDDTAVLQQSLDYFAEYSEALKCIADKDLLAVLAEILEDASARAQNRA